LTECNSVSDLYIIDFSHCFSIYQMLKNLEGLKINVITNDFKQYMDDNVTTFNIFREVYLNVEKNSSLVYKVKLGNTDYSYVGLFGQRLTDFDNGLKFIELVQQSGRQIHGYRWREGEDERGLTYCLFDSSKISFPRTQEIHL
jgi:hypothetical protein